MNDRRIVFRFPEGANKFSFLQNVQTDFYVQLSDS